MNRENKFSRQSIVKRSELITNEHLSFIYQRLLDNFSNLSNSKFTIFDG